MFMDERKLLSNKNCLRYSPKYNLLETTWKRRRKKICKRKGNVPSVFMSWS